MSESAKAVFLSYAREDAEAAKHIAEALRGFGVEVWFDQSELRGGDQWDARIRGQIKTCALFIPVISATTQSREEAYFRLEWKLADDRSHLMAPGKPFIVPVVIDDTPETGAMAPDSFSRSQWTRLPGALPTPEFVAQVKRLMSKEQGAGSKEPVARVSRPVGSEITGQETRATGKKAIPGWTWGALTAVVIGIAVALSVSRKPGPAPAAPVIALPPASVLPSPSRPPSVDAKSIAVLPFENRSENKADLFFTDGVHDDLLTQISRIKDIKTISRTSVMTYRGSAKKIREIAGELGVATILEGGVQRAGNQVRINVQLIDARTDAHLWAETYTRELTAENIFAIQSEIATAIATALKAALSPEEQQRMGKLPTANLQALEAYFKGKAELEKYTTASLAAAIPHYEQAIALDPGFAEASAGLARVLMHQIFFSGFPSGEQLAKAEPLVRRALALNSLLPEAYIELGMLHTQRNQLPEAEAAYRRAIELGPNTVNAYKAYGSFFQYHLHDPARAVTLLSKAVEVDPKDGGAGMMLADALRADYQADAALGLLEALVRGEAERASRHQAMASLQQENLHHYDLAIRFYRQALALDPGRPDLRRGIAESYGDLGDLPATEHWLTQFSEQAPGDYWVPFYRGLLSWWKGDLAAAMAQFGRMPEDRFALRMIGSISPDPVRRQEALRRLRLIDPRFMQPDAVVKGDAFSIWDEVHFAVFLVANGQQARAADLARRIIAALPPEPKARRQIIGSVAAAYVIAGDKVGAMRELRDYVEHGGAILLRSDLASLSTRLIDRELASEPGFPELKTTMNKRIEEQRANLAKWEAAGELAPIPPLPEAKK